MITARFTQFSSSRTFPGQRWASIAATASARSEIEPRFCSVGDAPYEGVREQACIPGPAPQRRNRDDDLGEAIVKILAEPAGRDQILQVLVRRADDAHVDRDLLAPADALDHPLLQEPQQLRLERRRQVADLVEEQRPAVGHLDLAQGLRAPPR